MWLWPSSCCRPSPFSVVRPGGAAEQEAARAHVARRPCQIAHALETEHRIEDVERNHRNAVRAVGRGRRDPRRHRARLVDAFLQNLAGLVLLVEHQLLGVLRRVELADVRIDGELAEHAFHAEGARFVGHDRHHQLADLLVAHQRRQDAHERHGSGHLASLAGRLEQGLERRQRRHFERRRFAPPRRQVAAERLAPLAHVSEFGRAFLEPDVRDFVELVVGHRNPEMVAERLDRRHPHFLLLMGDVLRFAPLAHAVALDGLGKNHRRLSCVLHCRRVGGVDLVGIVAAAVQAPDVVIRHRRDHLQQFGVLAEEVLAHIGPVLGLERLVLAVDAFLHALQQQPIGVAHEQRLPVAAPDHLDHVPAGAAEIGLEFLDDLAVAAYRAVEPLQIAVDDKDQVVEPLASSERNRAERLRLVRLAVTHERPYFTAFRLAQTAVPQIAHEARLIDRHQRPQPHRHRRELPEIRHQPRVRVRRQALAVDLLAEVVHLLLGEPSQQERAGVNAGRGMTLREDQVAADVLARGAPEMVVADVKQRGGRSKARDMPADVGVLVGAQHHGKRVPAHVSADAVFEFVVARRTLFLRCRDGVDVSGVERERKISAGAARLFHQLLDQEVGALLHLRVSGRRRATPAIPVFPAGRCQE